MKRATHTTLISFYTIVILAAIIFFTYTGYSFYRLPIEQRFFHPMYNVLKPSGLIGHGLGIFGSFFLVFGLFSYMARKRLRIFSNWGKLKYWLEFHIFLCTLGPVLILFHTSFKFGGIVSVGFWSMAIVWASGVFGRFIYLQIPHTIEGRELDQKEIEAGITDLHLGLQQKYQLEIQDISSLTHNQVTNLLKAKGVHKKEYKQIRQQLREEKKMAKVISRLERMRSLFKYWHYAHLPFALILLIIMLIHIVVVVTFGYWWIL